MRLRNKLTFHIVSVQIRHRKDSQAVQMSKVPPKVAEVILTLLIADVGHVEGPKRFQHFVAHITQYAACQMAEHQLDLTVHQPTGIWKAMLRRFHPLDGDD